MLVNNIAKYGKNSSTTVHPVKRTRQFVTYVSSFIANSQLNDFEDVDEAQMSLRATPPGLGIRDGPLARYFILNGSEYLCIYMIWFYIDKEKQTVTCTFNGHGLISPISKSGFIIIC